MTILVDMWKKAKENSSGKWWLPQKDCSVCHGSGNDPEQDHVKDVWMAPCPECMVMTQKHNCVLYHKLFLPLEASDLVG